MNIPEEFRKCVVFLGYLKDGKPVWAGTGFFVGCELTSDDDRLVSYLVTAQHVINKIHRKKDSDGKVYLRINVNTNDAIEVPTEFADWFTHPTRETDVAAIPYSIDMPENADYRNIPLLNFVGVGDAPLGGMSPGHKVFITGLFTSHAGRKRNIPIIRAGNIAGMPAEPMTINLGDGTRVSVRAYLIEARSIGGLSGSPVFLYKDLFRLRDGGGFSLDGYDIRLIGLMYGHWTREAEPESNDEALASVMFDEDVRDKLHTGIGIVIPSEDIAEVLNQPVLIEQRQLLAAEIDA